MQTSWARICVAQTSAGQILAEQDLEGQTSGGANLQWANLRWARLWSAHLGEANLCWAVLIGAGLQKANMDEAVLNSTIFVDVDLSETQGLKTVHHDGPSPIGVDTIYRSQGRIPLEFLRGAGAPENFITFMHSLVGTAFEYYSCFISYSSRDQEFAERLHADLQSKGVRCRFAHEDLKIGEKLRPSLDDAIRLHDKLMVILSESSVKSQWVGKEVETAFEKERQQDRTVLFPIRLDDAIMETEEAWAADIRRTRHIGDFREWKNHDSYKKAFDRLLRDLRAEDKAVSTAKSGR
jgi:hypothetical protein